MYFSHLAGLHNVRSSKQKLKYFALRRADAAYQFAVAL
jgi:hypothetical protein